MLKLTKVDVVLVGWRYFNSLRTEDEPIYNYNDTYMRWFLRQSLKGGRVCAFNQYYKSKICHDILKIISEELNVNGKIYDIIETYLEYKNKHLEIFKREYESKFNDYRDEDKKEKENFINEKLSKLPKHQLLKEIKLEEMLWDFDAVSLYPSAIWDEKSIYPINETGYAFTKVMNDELVEKFDSGNFTQESAIYN